MHQRSAAADLHTTSATLLEAICTVLERDVMGTQAIYYLMHLIPSGLVGCSVSQSSRSSWRELARFNLLASGRVFAVRRASGRAEATARRAWLVELGANSTNFSALFPCVSALVVRLAFTSLPNCVPARECAFEAAAPLPPLLHTWGNGTQRRPKAHLLQLYLVIHAVPQ
jgi:hypothetical protein